MPPSQPILILATDSACYLESLWKSELLWTTEMWFPSTTTLIPSPNWALLELWVLYSVCSYPNPYSELPSSQSVLLFLPLGTFSRVPARDSDSSLQPLLWFQGPFGPHTWHDALLPAYFLLPTLGTFDSWFFMTLCPMVLGYRCIN